MRCKRCGSIDIVLFKDIHRCKVCDSPNIIDETTGNIKQGDGVENKQYSNLTPKLWNPNAAACWSIIFNPIFGAWVHARNWRSLNRPKEEKWSMYFVYGLILFYLFLIFGPTPKTSATALTSGILFTWYFSLGKQQVNYIKENISDYQKKSWIKPLLYGIFGYGIFITVGLGFAFLAPISTDDIEESAVPLVTQILQDQLKENKTCKSVSVTSELPNGTYEAVAKLDDGTRIKIVIQLEDGMLYVSIP